MYMSPVLLSTLIGIVSFIISVSVSAFVSGMRWGQMTYHVTSIDNRLARIEGMFVMVPVGQQQQPNQGTGR